jgi:hypothetical protein
MLALSDNVQVAFFIISSVSTFASLALGILAKSIASKYERLRDQLEKTTEAEMARRFELLETKVMGKVDKLISEIESAQRRLSAGDRKFGEINERYHEGQIKILNAFNQLRSDIFSTVPTKAEVEALRHGQNAIEQKVAAIKGAA